jgi:ribonuclease HI
MQADEELHVVIWVDGSAKYDIPGKPKRGPNARLWCAYQIEWQGSILRREFIEIDFVGTINQAEFLAAVYAISAAKQIGATHVCLYSDSSLVVNAINRTDGKQSSVPGSKEWTEEIKRSIQDDFKHVVVAWVPRKQNAVDAYLSNCLGLKRSPKKKAERALDNEKYK